MGALVGACVGEGVGGGVGLLAREALAGRVFGAEVKDALRPPAELAVAEAAGVGLTDDAGVAALAGAELDGGAA